MPPRESGAASVTRIEPGIIRRVSAGLSVMFTGRAPDGFFGPGEPIAPAAQETAGRAFDYPAGFNIGTRPRSTEAVTFAQLRGLARSYDLVRLAIETRKDQMEKLDWSIQRVDGAPTDTDSKAKGLETFLRRPDGEHTFRRWLRILVEDLLVIDAPTVYVRPNRGGGVYAFEVVDGATIARVLDDRGRTPEPPAPAYQQILKGIAAADFTRDELFYRPRNISSHAVYGFSPVEQIIMLVNIGLRRQVSQLEYYTAGSVPDVLLGVPTTWNPKQISDFQTQWDALMAGDLAARRRAKFVPGDVKSVFTKTPESLFDEFDEWLARVVSYAFSLPPTAFVKQQNRATAGTAQEAALEEGLAPIMSWTKDLMDELIQGPLGAPEYEFSYKETRDVDPLVQAQIAQIYVTAKVLTADEVREDLGRDALTAEQKAELTPPAPTQLEPGAHADAKGNPDGVTAAAAEKAAAGRSLPRARERWRL